MSTAELACSYAALILADDGVEVTVRTWPLLQCPGNVCAMDGRNVMCYGCVGMMAAGHVCVEEEVPEFGKLERERKGP